jgi:glycogen operon protein
VLAARRRDARNLLGTLLLATGVPMITGGDELGRTQRGNNNAYCLDDETSWIDWDLKPDQLALLATTAHLLRLRHDHPVLRQDRFFAGRPVHRDGTKDLAWFGPDGTEMDHGRWHEPSLRTLQMYLHAVEPDGLGRHVDESLLVIMQGAGWPVAVRLPGLPWASRYRLLWDSAHDLPPGAPGGPQSVDEPGGAVLTVDAATIRVYGATSAP